MTEQDHREYADEPGGLCSICGEPVTDADYEANNVDYERGFPATQIDLAEPFTLHHVACPPSDDWHGRD